MTAVLGTGVSLNQANTGDTRGHQDARRR
jgi:hypothetical protein